jgi:hypothetical protein
MVGDYLILKKVMSLEGSKSENELHRLREILEHSTVENIVENCRKYLGLLNAYRAELSLFRNSPEISRVQKSSVELIAVEQIRQEIRTAIEICVSERRRIETLLKSFTAISGYEALSIFNYCKYKGFDNWQLKAGGIRFGGGNETDKISIQDAVIIASELRREEYLTRQITV